MAEIVLPLPNARSVLGRAYDSPNLAVKMAGASLRVTTRDGLEC
jgi:hypothetical protein